MHLDLHQCNENQGELGGDCVRASGQLAKSACRLLRCHCKQADGRCGTHCAGLLFNSGTPFAQGTFLLTAAFHQIDSFVPSNFVLKLHHRNHNQLVDHEFNRRPQVSPTYLTSGLPFNVLIDLLTQVMSRVHTMGRSRHCLIHDHIEYDLKGITCDAESRFAAR